jgi:hypothetical protein
LKVIPKTEIIKVSPFIFDAPIEKTEKKPKDLLRNFCSLPQDSNKIDL